MDKDRKTFHCIRPRYTPGIPCIVHFEFAKQFSIEERNAYRAVMRGEKGQEQKERAERLGLESIAITKIKHTDKKGRVTWSVMDLITNRNYVVSDGPPETKYKPLYIFSIEIMNDWDESTDKASEYILNMRELSYLSDKTASGETGAEVVIKFLANANDWKSGMSVTIKKDLKKILCENISEIEDENMKAMAKVICKRSC